MIICFEGMIDVCQSFWVFQARTLHTGFIIVSISCFTACVLCQCVSAYMNGEKVRECFFPSASSKNRVYPCVHVCAQNDNEA